MKIWRQLNVIHRTVIWVVISCLIVHYGVITVKAMPVETWVSGTWDCKYYFDRTVESNHVKEQTRLALGGSTLPCSDKGNIQVIQLKSDGGIRVLLKDGSSETGTYRLQHYEGLGWDECPCDEWVLLTDIKLPDLFSGLSESGENAYLVQRQGVQQLVLGGYEGSNGRDRIHLKKVFTQVNAVIPPQFWITGRYRTMSASRVMWEVKGVHLTRQDITVSYDDGREESGKYTLGPDTFRDECQCTGTLLTDVPIGKLAYHKTVEGKFVYLIEQHVWPVLKILEVDPAEEVGVIFLAKPDNPIEWVAMEANNRLWSTIID